MLKQDALIEPARGQRESLRADSRDEARAPMARGEAGVAHRLRVPAAIDDWRLGVDGRTTEKEAAAIGEHR